MSKTILKIISDKYLRIAVYSPKLLIRLVLRKISRKRNRPILTDKKSIESNNNSYNTPQRRRILFFTQKMKNTDFDVIFLKKLTAVKSKPKKNRENIANKFIVTLATTAIDIRFIDFTHNYSDPEDTYAINRFIWLYELLLYGIDKEINDICLKNIENWVGSIEASKMDEAFDAYSASERIIAWIFYFKSVKNKFVFSDTVLKNIARSIGKQCNAIRHSLEYHGNNTNNHILNNARALYIAGSVFGQNECIELGRMIMLSEYGNIIIDGVNQEGSSHYQMLLTKNLLEVLMIAEEYNDVPFISFLNNNISQMTLICQELSGSSGFTHYPLFGDISPDMHPGWFRGWPFSANRELYSDWYRLFNYFPTMNNQTNRNNDAASSSVHWIYLHNGSIEAWVNLRTGEIPCHGHNDNGTIQIHYLGKPIIADLGLKTYNASPTRDFHRSSTSHNMPIINGYGVDIPQNSLVSNIGLHSTYNILNVNDNTITYTINYVNNAIMVKRKLILVNDGFTVLDNFRFGCYQTYWHFNGRLDKLNASEYQYGDIIVECKVEENETIELIDKHFRSTKYGGKKEISTLLMSTNTRNIVSVESKFKFRNG
jgi:hypothetical protein